MSSSSLLPSVACLEGMFLTPAPSGTAGAAKDLHGRFGRV
jgi:hypothetical protein